MDPITLILNALGAGALAGGQSIASDAIKDAYAGLKTRLQQKFAGKPKDEIALIEYETDPTICEAPLKKALKQAQVDQDEEIIDIAQRMMILVRPQQVASGKYNVQITGNVQGLAHGHNQQVTMNFGNSQTEAK